MSAARPEAVHDLSSFADILQNLQEAGFDFVVIGGAAISAYARLLQTRVATVDLDLYVTPANLEEILRWSPRHGFKVLKRPQPRNIPVAFLEAGGREVNLLTASFGLPSPDIVIRQARSFALTGSDLEVPVADPFDLLANKLAVRREKDLPHIEFLKVFLEEEVVEAFAAEDLPRRRIAPARRYLDTLGVAALPEALGDRLLALARTPADYRFLASRLPRRDQLERLLKGIADAELLAEIESIVSTRTLPAEA